MSIAYEMNVEKDVLVVRAWGFDDSRAEVEAYGKAVLSKCIECGITRVLCNETDLEYRLGTVDTYYLASQMATIVPHVARIALVSSPRCAADASFYETVAVNRGLSMRAFPDVDSAWQWLTGRSFGAAGGAATSSMSPSA